MSYPRMEQLKEWLMMSNDEKIDFDEYANNYESLLSNQLRFFNSDRNYFSEYKVRLTKNRLTTIPKKILDFGSGIGLSAPFLKKYFPAAQIYASDTSIKSLEHIKNTYQNVIVIHDDLLDGEDFDLIFVTGVFHHIPPEEREKVLLRLITLLSDKGNLVIFEHNPYNPVTRRMVATCPFDADAKLITKTELLSLISKMPEISPKESGYCLFFPESLKTLRMVEEKISWIPMGGQYFVIAKKLEAL